MLLVSIRDRLSTGERLLSWNGSIDAKSVFCQHSMGTRGHLFFECSFSAHILEGLMRCVLGESVHNRLEQLTKAVIRLYAGEDTTFCKKIHVSVDYS